jgi:hypothetical protein
MELSYDPYSYAMASAEHGSDQARQAQDVRLVVDTIPTLAGSARADGVARSVSTSAAISRAWRGPSGQALPPLHMWFGKNQAVC